MNTCSNCGAEYFVIEAFWPHGLCINCYKNRVEVRSFSAEQLLTIDKIKAEAQNEEDTL